MTLEFLAGLGAGVLFTFVFAKVVFRLMSVKCKTCHYRTWKHMLKYPQCDGCGYRHPPKCTKCGHKGKIEVFDE